MYLLFPSVHTVYNNLDQATLFCRQEAAAFTKVALLLALGSLLCRWQFQAGLMEEILHQFLNVGKYEAL